MKIFLAAVSLLAIVPPVFAGEREPPECYSGRFREPFCPYKFVRKGGTVFVVKQESDVIMLPHWPFVVVTSPRR